MLNPRLLLVLFAATLCGMIAIPMLPIWHGAARLLMLGALWLYLPAPYKKRCCIILAGLLTINIAGLAYQFMQTPFGTLRGLFFDIYGVPLSIFADAALVCFDAVAIFTGFMLLRQKYMAIHTQNMHQIFSTYLPLNALTGFFFAAAISTIIVSLSKEASEAAQMLSGLSGWGFWVHVSLLVLLLVQSKGDIFRLIHAMLLGGIFVALMIGVQWLLRDFSYVLDSISYEHYFTRVRASYYYHAPATFAVMMAGALAFCYYAGRPRYIWFILLAGLLALALLNSTRGLNVACIAMLAHTGLLLLIKRRWLGAVLCVLIAAFFWGHVTYTKPISGEQDAMMQAALKKQQKVIHSDDKVKDTSLNKTAPPLADDKEIEQLVQSNQSRMILYKAGIYAILDAPLFGHGIGLDSVTITGGAFNGILATYSSHMLYLDIALMAGLPALLFTLLFFAIICLRSYPTILFSKKAKSQDMAFVQIGLLGALVVYAAAGLFIPQERHELTAIGFVMAALLYACQLLPEHTRAKADHCNSQKQCSVLYALILLGTVGYSAITSPSYVFPALEFTARHGKEVKAEEQHVYANDPALTRLLQLILGAWYGVPSENITQLENNAQALPEAPSWLIWSPQADYHYAALREELGYRLFRHKGSAPSVAFSHRWWVVGNFQPAVHFVFAGKRPLNLTDEIQNSTYAPKLWNNSTLDASLEVTGLHVGGKLAVLNDLAYSSPAKFNRCEDMLLTFSYDKPTRLGAYIIHMPRQSSTTPEVYSWSVEGRSDKKNWTRIDHQQNQPLPSREQQLGPYFIESNQLFTMIRIRFKKQTGDCEAEPLSLTEIELYTK